MLAYPIGHFSSFQPSPHEQKSSAKQSDLRMGAAIAGARSAKQSAFIEVEGREHGDLRMPSAIAAARVPAPARVSSTHFSFHVKALQSETQMGFEMGLSANCVRIGGQSNPKIA